jgi:hypothetical protein
MRHLYLLVFLLAPAALASDDERGPNVDQTVDVSTVVNANASMSGGDSINTMNNSTSSRAYGFGLGDVDIAQCYRSYQLLIWQDSKINPFCVADIYDRKGLHMMAAVIRCDIGFIRKHFDTDSGCLAANTMRAAVMPSPDLGAVYEQAAKDVKQTHDDDDDERRQQIEEAQNYMRSLEARLDRSDANRRANIARYEKEQAQLRQYAQDALDKLPEQQHEP